MTDINERSEPDISSPRAEYVGRLEARRTLAAQQARLHGIIADARLAAFLAGIVVAGLAFWAERVAATWVLTPVFVFVALVIWHGRVTVLRKRAERAALFYERGLARLDNRWIGKGEPGTRFL